ncbi:MAG: hypothetical protein AB1430_18150 [Pseudomonadota bacterium]
MKHLRCVTTALAPLALLAACSSAPRPAAEVPAALLNPSVTPQNVQQTICVPAYAASVMPPEAQLRGVMLEIMQRAGMDPALAGSYVLDHRIPVGLGGHPSERANLQILERGGAYGAQRKQALQRRLLLRVCENKMGLREAQAAMYPEWEPAYGLYVTGPAR